MTVLGILTCEVLEEEISYLLLREKEFIKINIISSEHSSGIAERLSSDARTSVLQDLAEFQPSPGPGMEVIVEVLNVGLHMVKKELQDGVFTNIRKLREVCDGLLLGYGLCGNSLEYLEEEIKDVPIPVVMPTNPNGSRIDDCVCMVLGETQEYLKEVKKEAGTWFVTPGWVKHWDTLLLKELGAKDIKTVKWIFDKAHYSRALKINTEGCYDKQVYAAGAKAFADTFNFRLDEREGSLQILVAALDRAKNLARQKGG